MMDWMQIWGSPLQGGELQYHRYRIIGALRHRVDIDLNIPEFLIISQERRRQAWIEYDRKAVT